MQLFFKNKIFVIIVLCLILIVNPVMPVIAQASGKAVLKDIVITNDRDDLISYFKVQGAFTKKITEAVFNGVPTSFSFLVFIYKTRSAWFDRKIAGLKFTSTLKYNALKKEFTVIRPWKTEKPWVTKSFEQARMMMTNVDNLKIVSLNRLKKGEKYQLRFKAELSRVTLPLYLHYVFFFVSLWDFDTDWHTIDFVY